MSGGGAWIGSPLRVSYVLGTTAGGTGRHVAMLAGGCREAGGEVSVFGPEGTRSLFAAGVRFGAAEISDRPRPGRDIAVIRRLAGLLRQAQPAVVHAHGLRAGALAVLALGLGRLRAGERTAHSDGGASDGPGDRGGDSGQRGRGDGPALVVTIHNAPPPGVGKATVYGGLERLVARRADAVLCVSADLEDRMRRLSARNVGRAVVAAPAGPGGTAPDVAAIRAELGATGRPLVLAAGRLTTQKGFDLLLAAAARWGARPDGAAPGAAARGGPPAQAGAAGPADTAGPLLVIAGAGPDRPALAQLARQLGVDVRLLGARTDLPALLAAAAVFVLPSRWEGQPLVLQEALRAGLPVVAFDVGGVDAVAGGAALLVPAGDVAALAGAVSRVLAEPELAAGLSAAATARARELPDEAGAISAALALYARLSGAGPPEVITP